MEPETHSETLGRHERMPSTFALQESIRSNSRRQTAGVRAESVIVDRGAGKVQRKRGSAPDVVKLGSVQLDAARVTLTGREFEHATASLGRSVGVVGRVDREELQDLLLALAVRIGPTRVDIGKGAAAVDRDPDRVVRDCVCRQD